MSSLVSTPATIADALWHEREETKWVRFAILAVLGSVALAISAKIKVPIEPVPITMQTFVILTMSMALGWRLAGATVILYLAEGFVGIPVFTNTPPAVAGPAYFAGTTGGYLVGFFLAAVAVGWLAERGWDRNAFTTAAAMLVGMVLIYLPGVPWLAYLIGWEKALVWGLEYFMISELIKLALASAVLPLVWTVIRKRGAKQAPDA